MRHLTQTYLRHERGALPPHARRGRAFEEPATPIDEANTCIRLWLEPTLAAIEPMVILCLGAPAANAIIKKASR
jgi:uracil-DNA glycosylase